MSSRPRRVLTGLVAAAAALAVLPATALAAGESFSLVPSNPQAGGLTSVTATYSFDPADTAKTVVTSLAPGILGNLNANPSCLVSQQFTPACQVGTETTQTTVGTVSGTLYLVPAQSGSNDVAGIEAVPGGATMGQYIGVSPNPNAPGGLNLTTTFPEPPAGQIVGFTANFGSLGGQLFTRLPSSCALATSSFTVSYYKGTTPGRASSSFAPTGCPNLPYQPALSAAITKDKRGNGAAVTVGVTQAANESASKQIVLTLPKGLTPNVGALGSCTSGCTIGTATATSPLIPSIAFSGGTLKLTVSGTTPTISVVFPALGITLTGTVSLVNNSVTFANVPDVPLTSLTLNVTGPNGAKTFNTDCKSANVTGTFTPQSGTPAKTVTSRVKFTGCAGATGSTSGLAKGQPKVKFTVTDGQKVASVAIGLPGGLRFSHSAFVTHRVCTTKPKRCTTTTLISGLGISGANAKSVSLKRGRLVVTLKKAAAKVTITVSGPLVAESPGLQGKVKHHRVKTLKFTLKITDASKAASTVVLKLKAH